MRGLLNVFLRILALQLGTTGGEEIPLGDGLPEVEYRPHLFGLLY